MSRSEFGVDEDCDEEGFRRLMYKIIVKPPEDELEDDFGDWVSIEELDKNAPTLDLGSFGQTILDKSSVSSTATPSTAHYGCTTKLGNIGLSTYSSTYSTCISTSTAAAVGTKLNAAKENNINHSTFTLFDHKTLSQSISREA